MPVVSKKQQKFMQAVANNPEFAKKAGVKQSIGREFTKEKDMKKAVKKMNMGGRAMNDRDGSVAMDPRMQMAMAAQQKQAAMGGMKKGGKVKGYKAGGMADKMGRALAKDNKGMTAAQLKDAGGRAMATGGMLARTGGSSAKMKAKGKAMKKGGTVKGRGNASKRADGIAQQGHTRGRIV
jgi:hypothetical protein